jgi:hypothetical protein
VKRDVLHGDGIAWLQQAELGPEHAIVTSLPDLSELDLSFEQWRRWFIDVATLVCRSVDTAVFYQTDIKLDGAWIDKAHLVQYGADEAGSRCLWHKIVCRKAPGQTSFGRPAYGHWLAFSRSLRLQPGESTADVVPELGEMIWSRAMPMNAAVGTCTFLAKHTPCSIVVDPFCGRGTILAVANAHGMDAIGVERSKKRARKARNLVLQGQGAKCVPEIMPRSSHFSTGGN